MKSKKVSELQLSFFAPSFEEQLNPKNGVYLLAKEIDWKYFEHDFSRLYSIGYF